MRNLPLPHPLGIYRGKTYSRYQVRVSQSSLDAHAEADLEIVAASPADACNAIRDELAPHVEHPTEIACAGPKGGITHRFIGWESMIGAKMFLPKPDYTQLSLFARKPVEPVPLTQPEPIRLAA